MHEGRRSGRPRRTIRTRVATPASASPARPSPSASPRSRGSVTIAHAPTPPNSTMPAGRGAAVGASSAIDKHPRRTAAATPTTLGDQRWLVVGPAEPGWEQLLQRRRELVDEHRAGPRPAMSPTSAGRLADGEGHGPAVTAPMDSRPSARPRGCGRGGQEGGVRWVERWLALGVVKARIASSDAGVTGPRRKDRQLGTPDSHPCPGGRRRPYDRTMNTSGTGPVLVVDDEPMVLEVVAGTSNSMVTACARGPESDAAMEMALGQRPGSSWCST